MNNYRLASQSVVDKLAQFIRQVDGNNKMGAGALADKICERFRVDAPDVQGEPVAVVDADDDGMWADILPNVTVKVGQELYAAAQPVEQQPAPDVAELQKYKRLVEDIADLFHIGNEARTPSIILANVENAKASADKYHSTPDVSALVEALELISDTDPDEGTAWFHGIANKALTAYRKEEET